MRPQPYIGVTGFMYSQEVRQVLNALPHDATHRLMVGVLASQKSFRNETTKWPKRYPHKNVIGDIFVDDPRVLNLVHYHSASNDRALAWEMDEVRRAAGPRCHGLQLNVTWPSLNCFRTYHKIRENSTNKSRTTIVLQCGKAAMAAVGNNPAALADRIWAYQGLVDYVLIDPSGGAGVAFDEQFALACFDAIAAGAPQVGLVIAGGVYAQSISKLSRIAHKHPRSSVDAEGRLRNERDDFVVDAACEYVHAAARLYGREYERT